MNDTLATKLAHTCYVSGLKSSILDVYTLEIQRRQQVQNYYYI